MPHPFQIFSQSKSLIQIVDINSHSERQTVQIQISWLLQKPADLDLHCLQNRVYSGSAGQGLKKYLHFFSKKKKKKKPHIWTYNDDLHHALSHYKTRQWEFSVVVVYFCADISCLFRNCHRKTVPLNTHMIISVQI